MRPLFRRATCALLVPTLLGSQLVLAASAIWPAPSPQPRPGPTPPVQLLTQPNFQAPSAVDCRRPIETREVSDGQPLPQNRPWPTPAPSGAVPTAPPAPVPYGALHSGSAVADARGKAEVRRDAGEAAARAESLAAAPGMASSKMAAGASADAPYAAPPAAQNVAPPQERVTAGMVDDNAAFSEYLAFRKRTPVPHRARDIRERYLLEVSDAQGRVVPDAEVVVQAANGAATWLRTDAGGHAWVHPDAFDPGHSGFYEVTARLGGHQSSAVLQRGQKSAVEVRIDSSRPQARARLDLVFLVDATGSMGDEIDKLKGSLRSITDEVARLPSHPDLCLGLVAYRDRGDAFFVRSHDLTNDINAFQGVLNALQAGGGGDEPEAMNEALHEAVHHISWRGDGATRLLVLVADAPPHLDYGGLQYDDDMLVALGKGIKLMAVGCSGLNKQGEYIQRQMAQYTGGRFIFLTYADASNPASGAGRETVHDVRNYSVQTLDKLVVRLVREELDKLPRG